MKASPLAVDIGVITVIGIELQSLCKILGLTDDVRSSAGNVGLVWHGSWANTVSRRSVTVAVHCIGEPGQGSAAAATTRFLEHFSPGMMILCGIAAGRRGRVKIGDIAVSRDIADFSSGVATKEGVTPRPHIPRPMFAVQQMLAGFQADRPALTRKITEFLPLPLKAPPGIEDEYRKHVSESPDVCDCTIGSSNLLLRDSRTLENWSTHHQGVKIGEMEAGGFVTACLNRPAPVPWLVVRGVSDFGDEFKGDQFHAYASYAPAAYVRQFIEHGFDAQLIAPSSRPAPEAKRQPHRLKIEIKGMSNTVDLIETDESLAGAQTIQVDGVRQNQSVSVAGHTMLELVITGQNNQVSGSAAMRARCHIQDLGQGNRIDFRDL